MIALARLKGFRARLPPTACLACLLSGCGDPAPVAPPQALRATAESAAPTSAARSTVSKDLLVDKTFDDIKFDIEPDAPYDPSMLTDAIRELDGQRLRIRGYIFPTAQKRGIKQFVLVRDNLECCFGPGAALYDCILVEMQGAASAEFSVRPVAVEGRFALSEFLGPDGRPLAIYRLAGEAVD